MCHPYDTRSVSKGNLACVTLVKTDKQRELGNSLGQWIDSLAEAIHVTIVDVTQIGRAEIWPTEFALLFYLAEGHKSSFYQFCT